MKQEDKELLLKDLCARLPYDVKGVVTFHKNMTETREEVRIIDGKLYDRFAKFQDSWYDNVTIKPYLFPLSSMTGEQYVEFVNLGNATSDDCFDGVNFNQLDWLIAHHFDYRGLIEKGLAIDATGKNVY